MRKSMIVLLFAWLALGNVQGVAASSTNNKCEQNRVLEDWVEQNHCSDIPFVVVGFDHRNETWTAHRVKCDQSGTNPHFDSLANFRPAKARLDLSEDEKLIAVVYDTNPLLYTVTKGEVTEREIGNLAALRQFVTAFSSVLQQAVQPVFVPPAQLPSGQDSRVYSTEIFIEDTISDLESHALKSEAGLEEEVDDARQQLLEDLTRLFEELEAPRKELGALVAATKDVKTTVDELDALSTTTLAYVQAVELNTDPPPLGEPPKLSTVVKAFNTLDTNRKKLATAAGELTCTAAYADLSRLLTLALEPAASWEVSERRKEFDGLLKKLRNLPDLHNQKCKPVDAFVTVASYLAGHRPSETPTLDGLDSWRLLRTNGAIYAAFVKKMAAVDTGAKELYAKREEAIEAAGALNRFQTRRASHFNSDTCSLRRGVLPVPGPHERPKAHKIRTTEVKIAADGFAADRIAKTHSTDLTTSFQVGAKGRIDWSVGFGLIHTEANAPEFKAVTNPLDLMDEEDAGTDDSEEPPKVIRRTGEDSLAGQPTALVSLWPKSQRWPEWLAVDLGAALDEDNPAGLVGLSFKLNSFARLGVGGMYYRFEDLGDGQTELELTDGMVDPASLTEVSGDDDIVRRDDWDWELYFSLVISIDGLNFFGPKESEE